MPSATPAKRRRPTRLAFRAKFTLAVRNVLRHRGRAFTTLGAVAFGVATLILSQGFVEDIFIQLGEAIIHSQTGHIQLAREGYFVHGAHKPDGYLVADPEGDKARIATLPEVEDVMARLGFPGLLSNGRADLPILGEGIEPAKEEKLGSFVKISSGRRLKADDHFHALLGDGVAKSLRLKVGDRAVLMVSTKDGATNTLDVEVVGTFQSFSKEYDNRAVKVPLAAAQELMNTKTANTLVVSLKQTAFTRKVANTLTERNVWRDQEVKMWDQINDFYPKTVALYGKQFGGLRMVILLMVLLSVVNAVNTGVFERTAEFGTARALGNRRRNILEIILIENSLLGLLGVAAGVGIGVGLAKAISYVGIPMPPPPNSDLPYVALVRVSWNAIITASAIGFTATFLASIFPAVKMARMDIASALRKSI